MATAPTNTYDSSLDLALGHVPQGADDNNELYQELLDIHNAIEQLANLTGATNSIPELLAYIAKQRNNTTVTGDYTVLITDGTIRVDASAGDVTITMHPVASGLGYKYYIKRIDTSSYEVLVLGDSGSELIDADDRGMRLASKGSRTLKSHSAGWDIL